MDPKEREAYCEEESSGRDMGTTLITIGFLVWFCDLAIAFFVSRDIMEGSGVFVTWLILGAIAGAVLIGIGWFQKRKANTKVDA
jgi:hypothetical protein